MTIFAGSALLRATIGIYGMMVYSVQRGTKRSAPDGARAEAEQVRRMVVFRGCACDDRRGRRGSWSRRTHPPESPVSCWVSTADHMVLSFLSPILPPSRPSPCGCRATGQSREPAWRPAYEDARVQTGARGLSSRVSHHSEVYSRHRRGFLVDGDVRRSEAMVHDWAGPSRQRRVRVAVRREQYYGRLRWDVAGPMLRKRLGKYGEDSGLGQ